MQAGGRIMTYDEEMDAEIRGEDEDELFVGSRRIYLAGEVIA